MALLSKQLQIATILEPFSNCHNTRVVFKFGYNRLYIFCLRGRLREKISINSKIFLQYQQKLCKCFSQLFYFQILYFYRKLAPLSPRILQNQLDCYPVGSLTSNGRLLNVHIGPVDVQKERSVDVQWTYQMKHNSSVQIGLKWTSISDLQGTPCMVPGRPLVPHQTSTRRLLDAHQMSYLTGMVPGRPFRPPSDVIFDEYC